MNCRWAGITVALLVLGLGGCASMSGDECVTGDWAAIGFEDGSRGYTPDRISGYRKACAKHGVTPDFQAYLRGRDQGLVEFCQPGRGFSLGANGGQYNGVCAADSEAEFLDAYRVGSELYRLRANVSQANSAIYAKQKQLEVTKDEMRAKEVALISDEATTEERVVLIADLVDLSERTGELESEIEMLIADRARHEQELEYYQQTVAMQGY